MSVVSVGRQLQDSRHVLFSQILDIIEILFLVFAILSSTLFLQQCQSQTMETLGGESYIWFDGVAPQNPETSRLKVIMNDEI